MLESLEHQSRAPDCVLVVDNGSSDGSAEIMNRWAKDTHLHNRVVRWDANRSSPLRNTLDLAREAFGSTWVTFPGDDDVLEVDHIESLLSAMSSHPQAKLVGGGVSLMEASGKLTGEEWLPDASLVSNQYRALGSLFNRPLFPWPALAFEPGALPDDVPHLQWTLDWWVQMQCTAAGPVATTDQASLRYRRHSGQESQLVSSARKQYEGAWMLNLAIASASVRALLSQMNQQQGEFLGNALLSSGGPIYGARVLSPAILMPLIAALSAEGRSARAIGTLEEQLQTSLGLIPDPGFRPWTAPPQGQSSVSAPQVLRVKLHPGTCARAQELAALGGLVTSATGKVEVGCEHVPKGQFRPRGVGHVVMDCEAGESDMQLAANSRRRVIAYLEERNPAAIGLTPGEWRAVAAFGRVKNSLPPALRGKLRRLFSRSS